MKSLALLFTLVSGSTSMSADDLAAWLKQRCIDQHPSSETRQQLCEDQHWANVDWYLRFVRSNRLKGLSPSEFQRRVEDGDRAAGVIALCAKASDQNKILMATCARKEWLQPEE